MVSTALRAQMTRLQQHSTPLVAALAMLGALALGEALLRESLLGEQHSLATVLAALGSLHGLIGLGSIGLAVLLWMLVLSRWQLSFWYPLWGVSAIPVVMMRWGVLTTLTAPTTLIGIMLVLVGAALLIRGGHS